MLMAITEHVKRPHSQESSLTKVTNENDYWSYRSNR